MEIDSLEITLGPLLFHWPEDKALDFYARIADETDVDRVYLGEIVCSKRWPFTDEWLERAGERLARAGKQVVWSSPAMPSAPRERKASLAVGARADLVELNDMTALAARAEGGAFVAGPLLSIYNEQAAAWLMQKGCVRLCPNVELSLDAVRAIAKACPELEIELFAFGRLPLAVSARCYHARRYGLHKDGCLFRCGEDLDGMDVRTIEGQAFLAVNGVQTLSHGYQCVDVPRQALLGAGVRALRLSPHSGDMVAIARAFRAFARGGEARALEAAVGAAIGGAALVSGYLHGVAGSKSAAL